MKNLVLFVVFFYIKKFFSTKITVFKVILILSIQDPKLDFINQINFSFPDESIDL